MEELNCMCDYKAKAKLYKLAIKVYNYYKEEVMCVELEYKNPAIISPLQSHVALTKNLQNRQNSAVSLAPCHNSCPQGLLSFARLARVICKPRDLTHFTPLQKHLYKKSLLFAALYYCHMHWNHRAFLPATVPFSLALYYIISTKICTSYLFNP
jgi:hypothetical protein